MARILIVDDAVEIQQVICELLSMCGHEVLTASSGPEAMDTLANTHPDLVLLDISMPGMNGFDVLSAMRSIPGTQDVKVMMMTALADRESIAKARSLGAMDFVIKGSVDIDDLLNRVDRCAAVNSGSSRYMS